MSTIIYHITTKEHWSQLATSEEFTAPTQLQEGFMHLCTQTQVAGVLERYFQGTPNLLLLHIDETQVAAPLRYEAATNQELFPHIYGPLNKSAIVTIEEL